MSIYLRSDVIERLVKDGRTPVFKILFHLQ